MWPFPDAGDIAESMLDTVVGWLARAILPALEALWGLLPQTACQPGRHRSSRCNLLRARDNHTADPDITRYKRIGCHPRGNAPST
jgi:hypothetical protein